MNFNARFAQEGYYGLTPVTLTLKTGYGKKKLLLENLLEKTPTL